MRFNTICCWGCLNLSPAAARAKPMLCIAFTAAWFSPGAQGVFQNCRHSLKGETIKSLNPPLGGYPKTGRWKLSKRYQSFINRYFGFWNTTCADPPKQWLYIKDDYDPKLEAFIIRRTISARVFVNRTKTGVEHIIPCHSEFKPILLNLINRLSRHISPFLFTCPSSRQEW